MRKLSRPEAFLESQGIPEELKWEWRPGQLKGWQIMEKPRMMRYRSENQNEMTGCR
jgi:hypothetical protein